MTEHLVGFDVVESPYLPPGTFLVGSLRDHGWTVGQGITIREDPWDPAPPRFTDYAKAERRKGLEHLAWLLDGMCADLGMDPDQVWRAPRLQAKFRRNEYTIRAEERMGFAIMRPEAFVV